MMKIAEFITTAMKSWQQPSDPGELLTFLANCYRARLREFDTQWYDARIDADTWRELRSRRAQLLEDLYVLNSVQNVVAGRPAVTATKQERRAPTGMYGEA
jgi:broad specificity phosphatase PhoE